MLLRGALSPGEEAGPVNPIMQDLLSNAATGAGAVGLMLLWIAAWFTIVTGWDYFSKGLPYIREKEEAAAKTVAEPED